jgi:hypothetical protein
MSNNFKKEPSNTGLSIDDLWNIKTHQLEIGIPEYNVDKIYFDYKKNIERKKIQSMFNSMIFDKAKFTNIKKLDSEGKEIIPTKKSFIDNIINYELKNNHSGKEKFPELYEKINPSYVKPTKEELIKLKTDPQKRLKLYSSDRRTCAEIIQKKLIKEQEIPENMQEKISLVNEKHEKLGLSRKLEPIETIKKNYHNKTSLR